MINDFWLVVRWWGTIFLVGVAAWPIARLLFREWFDEGYFFAKAIGMAVLTYITYSLGTIHVLPFTDVSVWIGLIIMFILGILTHKTYMTHKSYGSYRVFFLEEVFFLAALLFWSYIKAHEPTIRSLEKFMDFGFVQSALTHSFFPTPDLWYAGASINYYYFGHIVLAVLTKLSGLDLAYTFNLMLATIFALTLTMSFSIGFQIAHKSYASGILTAFLVTLGGNLQTIYAFTQGYAGDGVKPFWELLWPWGEFFQKLPEGANRYWYANATRFIPFSIHEFPSYSFVVSDIHGHVLSLPFVLLAIGILINIWGSDSHKKNFQFSNFNFQNLFYGFLVAILLTTNALDGPIYLALFLVILLLQKSQFPVKSWQWCREKGIPLFIVLIVASWTSLPFIVHFKSFVTGIGVNCPPSALANSKIGPLLFEGVEKCQHSPIWMLLVLWGFFIYCGIGLISHIRHLRLMSQIEKLLLIFFFFSIALIIFPEFFYFKDIYPMHFRSNTMFKLGYQAFILFSIVSGYTIIQLILEFRRKFRANFQFSIFNFQFQRLLFLIFLLPQLFLVSIYPVFSIRSYFGELKNYQGLYGLTWMKLEYPDDYAGIMWLKKNVSSKMAPVIVEADGDSYTDYNRFSVFTGIPTVVGWHVHEWLWRGSYDVVAPRSGDVSQIYESPDLNLTRMLLNRYNVRYIIVGNLERQKYKRLDEVKLSKLGKIVFKSKETAIYFFY